MEEAGEENLGRFSSCTGSGQSYILLLGVGRDGERHTYPSLVFVVQQKS